MSASVQSTGHRLQLGRTGPEPAPWFLSDSTSLQWWRHDVANALGLQTPRSLFDDDKDVQDSALRSPDFWKWPTQQSRTVGRPSDRSLRGRFISPQANDGSSPQTRPQSLSCIQRGSERRDQSRSARKVSRDDTDLLSAAEDLERLARSFREQADGILTGARDQDGHVATTSRPPSQRKPVRPLPRQASGSVDGTRDEVPHAAQPFGPAKLARRRGTSRELLNPQGIRGMRYVADPAQSIRSPVASIQGMYETFVTVYVPKDRFGKSTSAVLGLLDCVPDALPSPVTALEEATRTLVLVAIGGATRDRNLLKQAAKHYGKALSCLRTVITRPQVVHYEHTFAAIMVLLLCAHHDEVRLVDNGWVRHMWGAQQYFVARSSRSFKTPLGARAFSLARYASLNYSLLARKASVFAAFPNCGSVPDDHGPKWSASLFHISLQIPALLERHDKIQALRDTNSMALCQADWSDLETLERDCLEIELLLRAWNREWAARCAQLGVEVFRELRIEYFHPFSTLCKDRTFKTAYWFEDFSYAFLAVWYWISMFHVLQATASLEALRRAWIDGSAVGIEQTSYYLTELNLARNMCMCIPFLCQEQCGISGFTSSMLPLKLVGAFFQRYGLRDYLKWALEVRRTIFVKGVSPPPPNVTYQRPP